MAHKTKECVYAFLTSVIAGALIGIGGTIYLLVDNRVVGGLLFSVGLYCICSQKLNLYTGKVGYLIESNLKYLWFLLIVWVGNLCGTFLLATGIQLTRLNIIEAAETVSIVKQSDDLLSLFILGIFCGLLMFCAVDGYKDTKNPLIIMACVTVFIVCGFEHCIADMYFFFLGKMMTGYAFLQVLIITAGNSLGSFLIPICRRIAD